MKQSAGLFPVRFFCLTNRNVTVYKGFPGRTELVFFRLSEEKRLAKSLLYDEHDRFFASCLLRLTTNQHLHKVQYLVLLSGQDPGLIHLR